MIYILRDLIYIHKNIGKYSSKAYPRGSKASNNEYLDQAIFKLHFFKSRVFIIWHLDP